MKNKEIKVKDFENLLLEMFKEREGIIHNQQIKSGDYVYIPTYSGRLYWFNPTTQK